MTRENKQKIGRFRLATWPATLPAVRFLFAQPNKTLAQQRQMNISRRQRRCQQTKSLLGLLVMTLACLVGQPKFGLAQEVWTSGAIAKAAAAIRAHQSKSQNETKSQKKGSDKGDFEIQVSGTGTSGRIAKWTDDAGTLGNSVITELTNGNIGVGTTSPAAKLDVSGHLYVRNGFSLFADTISAYTGGATHMSISNQGTLDLITSGAAPITFATLGNEAMRIVSGGLVGIGTSSPLARLDVRGDSAFGFPTPGQVRGTLQITPTTNIAGNTAAITFGANDENGSIHNDAQAGIYVQSAGAYGTKMYFGTTNSFGIGAQSRMMIDHLGNIGIGTTAPAAKLHVAGGDVSVTGAGSVSLTGTGNITASGTISGGNVIAKYQDVAEWVPARNAIPPGTVVTLDPDHSNLVVASSHSYDTRVAGVVSEKPGVILGEGGEGKVMVATTGRVRVKVDATNGPIRVGDLLVTSDKEGIAMRSQPLDLGGTPIHRPGTLIGKALEPLEKGVGEILVLLSLQ